MTVVYGRDIVMAVCGFTRVSSSAKPPAHVGGFGLSTGEDKECDIINMRKDW